MLIYDWLPMGNINELEEAYNSYAESIVHELIEMAKQGSLRISPAYVQYTNIEIAVLNKHNDIIAKRIIQFSSLDAYEELQGSKVENPLLSAPPDYSYVSDVVDKNMLAKFLEINAPSIQMPLVGSEDLQRVKVIGIDIGDRMPDGDWDNFHEGLAFDFAENQES